MSPAADHAASCAAHAYWAHPELPLANSPWPLTRTPAECGSAHPAGQRATAARETAGVGAEAGGITDQLPTLNFDASSFDQLIDWERKKVTEPPLLRDLDDSRLRSLAQTPLNIAPYPVHTEAARWNEL